MKPFPPYGILGILLLIAGSCTASPELPQQERQLLKKIATERLCREPHDFLALQVLRSLHRQQEPELRTKKLEWLDASEPFHTSPYLPYESLGQRAFNIKD